MDDAVLQPPDPIPGARELFSLDPTVSHLNHGSYGAVPLNVQRTQQQLRDKMEANPMRFFSNGLVDRIVDARRQMATFLGADPEGTALVANATTGTAIVLQSLGLAPGDEVLTTDHGYGAVSLAVRRECERTGAVTRTLCVPLQASDEEIIKIIREGLRPGRTRLLIVDHLTSPTARLFPAAEIVSVAQEFGVPVLVDAAHAPGMLPVAVTSIGADFWVGNLHKWAYAPRSTAVLVVAPRWRDRIQPLAVSWQQESGFPLRVEWQATMDYTAWLAAPVGLVNLCEWGADRVRAHNAALAAYGQRVVGDALGVAPADLPEPGGPGMAMRGPGVAMRGPGVAMRLIPLPPGVATTFEAAAALRQQIADRLAAEVAVVGWRQRGWLRLCGQVYNRAEEYDRLAAGLASLLDLRR